jgi:hypothetical protein
MGSTRPRAARIRVMPCPTSTPFVAGKPAPWWTGTAPASVPSRPSTWTTGPGSPSGPWSPPACSAPRPASSPSKALLEVDSSADREAVTVSRGTLGRVDIVVGPEGPAIMWPKLTAWLETHSRVDRWEALGAGRPQAPDQRLQVQGRDDGHLAIGADGPESTALLRVGRSDVDASSWAALPCR